MGGVLPTMDLGWDKIIAEEIENMICRLKKRGINADKFTVELKGQNICDDWERPENEFRLLDGSIPETLFENPLDQHYRENRERENERKNKIDSDLTQDYFLEKMKRRMLQKNDKSKAPTEKNMVDILKQEHENKDYFEIGSWEELLWTLNKDRKEKKPEIQKKKRKPKTYKCDLCNCRYQHQDFVTFKKDKKICKKCKDIIDRLKNGGGE